MSYEEEIEEIDEITQKCEFDNNTIHCKFYINGNYVGEMKQDWKEEDGKDLSTLKIKGKKLLNILLKKGIKFS